MTHILIDSSADVTVTGGEEKGRGYAVWFRATADDPFRNAVAFSGSPAVLKEAFSRALDILDQALDR